MVHSMKEISRFAEVQSVRTAVRAIIDQGIVTIIALRSIAKTYSALSVKGEDTKKLTSE